MRKRELDEPYESLFRIQRALAGHISYLAACDANIAFTEYQLYESILRVLLIRKYDVKCEVSCKGFLPNEGSVGHKRIDFVAKKERYHFALEVKWPRKRINTLDVNLDYKKLAAFQKKYTNSQSFLCLFGRHSQINNINLSQGGFVTPKALPPIYAFFRRTQYGCKIYQLKIT
ncbi:MAG: hypothetical protein WC703_00855 [Candidatus Neomarinimicrobiota bacterium]